MPNPPFTKNKVLLKNMKHYGRGFHSLPIVLFVGLMLGFVSQPVPDGGMQWETFAGWLFRISVGYAAHLGVLYLFLWLNWLPREKTLMGLFPAMVGGALTTFVAMLVIFHEIFSAWGDVLFLFGTVISVSLIVQFFLYPTHCYNPLIQMQRERIVKARRKAANLPDADFILLEPSPEEIIQVDYKDLCMITINDHYLTYAYLENDQPREVTQYGRLKDLEDLLLGKLVKVNRSTLVNPSQIEKFTETEQGRIFIRGVKEPILVPKSRVKSVKAKIPF